MEGMCERGGEETRRRKGVEVRIKECGLPASYPKGGKATLECKIRVNGVGNNGQRKRHRLGKGRKRERETEREIERGEKVKD